MIRAWFLVFLTISKTRVASKTKLRQTQQGAANDRKLHVIKKLHET